MDENELIVYRASSLGMCVRALVAKRLGYNEVVSEQLQLAAREGNLHEQAEITQLREDGWEVTGAQHELDIPIIPGIVVRGHVDALDVRWPRDSSPPMFLEVKSMGADTWKRFQRERWAMPGFVQKYKWQISAYMHATQKLCFVLAKNRNSGKIYTTIVREPFYTLDEIRMRVLTAEAWAMKDELPACDTDDKFICPFPYLHETEDRAEELRDVEARGLCEQIVDAQARRDQAEQDVRELKGQLRELIGNPEKAKLNIGDEFTVSVYESHRTSYDMDKMKADGWDIDPYRTEVLFPALRVSRKEKRAARTDTGT